MKKNNFVLMYGNWRYYDDFEKVGFKTLRQVFQYIYLHHDELIEMSKDNEDFSILISQSDKSSSYLSK